MKLNWNSGLIIFRSGKSSRYDQAGRPVLLLPNRSMQCHELTHCVTPVSGPFPGACLDRTRSQDVRLISSTGGRKM